jgi:hypothetical protein
MSEERARTRIVFHIGLEKTGTTSFQSFCYDNRRRLLEHGVLYPTQSLAFSSRSRNHAPLVAAYLDGTGYVDLNMSSAWPRREDALASLRQEIDRAQAPTVLISAEHFSSRLYPREIERLAQDFADCDCRVAIVLRAHEPRICSAYSSTIRSGRTLTLTEYVAELALPGNGYIRCAETISRWEGAFGRANTFVFCFEKGRNVIDDLLRSLFGVEVPLETTSRYAENQSHGDAALEALRRINARLPQPDGGRGNALNLRLVAFARAWLLKSFALMSAHEGAKRLRLDDAQREIISEIVEADRRWLKEHYDLDLPALDAAPPGSARDFAQSQRVAGELLAKAPWTGAALLWLAQNSPF